MQMALMHCAVTTANPAVWDSVTVSGLEDIYVRIYIVCGGGSCPVWKGGLVGKIGGLGLVEGWLCNRGVWLNIRTL